MIGTPFFFNPKGVAPRAQGWRFAYPGKASKMIFNPEVGCGIFDGSALPAKRSI
jgi:hypothetical protein